MSGIWNHFLVKSPLVGQNLVRRVKKEAVRQENLESKGYRSPLCRMLRALQSVHNAKVSVGETTTSAATMFQGAKRGVGTLWENCVGPMVGLWDSLD